MMPVFSNEDKPKYVMTELGFLIFLSYFISLISDLEYSYYEQHDIWKFVDALEYRLVYGTAEFVLYSFFYWTMIKPYVFARRSWMIVFSLVLFVVTDHFYLTYAIHWLVAHTGFLSPGIRAKALASFALAHISIPVNYTLIIAVFPLTGFAFVMRSVHQDAQIRKMREQQLGAELNFLKAQLHPHFFFNTLNNIYALALKESGDTAPMVARLGEMMRYILYEAEQKHVPLIRETEFLSSYIEIQKIRYAGNHRIEFDVQGNTSGVSVSPLLFLPYIENAFKHGLEDEKTSGFVRAILCVTETEIILEVVNSRPEQKTESSGGIGLDNGAKRLELLYPGLHQLVITYDEEQYKVLLTLTRP